MNSDQTILIAPTSHLPDQPVLREMLKDFEAAKQIGERSARGAHWDIFRPDFDRLIRTEALWPRFRQMGVSYRFDDSFHTGNGRGKREMLPSYAVLEEAKTWRFDGRAVQIRIADFMAKVTGLLSWEEVAFLSECSIGNPPAVPIDGRDMKADWNDISQVFFAVQLKKLFDFGTGGSAARPVYLEIGAGYGSLAAKLRKLIPDLQCILLDLPEVNAVQRYYLSQAEPGAAILGAGSARDDMAAALERADYLLLPAALAERVPEGYVDLAANIRSFMEMPVSVVTDYIRTVERVAKSNGQFYCVNALEKSTSGDVVRLAEYPFDESWSMVSPPMPLPWQTHIVALSLRRGPPGDGFRAALASLTA
ncbi:putative sugar O-methyltransferase [Nisaea sediminum]|uniref:putative sugar O-methyltransferase n=1 Tax=Nisaea sediminum TaxID=2775867 RepID=UPI0018681BBF|nr:putative sugar O-methyltransferase [Nisaea sediminum]